MKAEKWLILGAIAALAGIAINKQLRIARHRFEDEQPDAEGRSSIDDVPEGAPEDVPTIQAAAEGRVPPRAPDLDEQVAPAAPL